MSGTNSIYTQFEQDGYYHAHNVFSAGEVQTLGQEFDRIVSQITQADENVNARWGGDETERIGGKDTVVLHTHQVQQFSAAWMQAFFHKGFLDVTEQLIGGDIVLHHSKLFQKPGEVGAPFPMHQDWTYFPSYADTMIAAIIWISEATDDMGCLRLYPGSHKLGRLTGTSGQAQSELMSSFPIEGAHILEAQPGDVTFFHYFTMHGSMPNRSDKVRKSVLVQLYSGTDEIEEGNRHPNAMLTLRGWNHKMTRAKAGRLH